MGCGMTDKGGGTRLVIAGGGTGGHVFPGLAVLEAVAAMTPLEVQWIGTDRKVEVDALSATPWAHRTLNVMPIKGTGIAGRIKALFMLPAACVRAMVWLREFRPHVVLGVGGYVSGPVMLAARCFRIPAAIHEQNMVPGLANRMAAGFARKVFVTYSDSARYFRNADIEVTGNPVRSAIIEAGRSVERDEGHTLTLLILGGSQGAAGLNRIASAAVRTLCQSGRKINVIHQTGAGAVEEIGNYYRKEGVNVELRPFIRDMAAAYRQADLVICRAGATTLAELTALGKPSILIPYPYAADNHQEKNAAAMTEAGASVAFRESDIGAVRLAGEIENIIMDKRRLEAMSDAAWQLGRRNAAVHIAEALLKLGGRQIGMQQHAKTLPHREIAADILGSAGFKGKTEDHVQETAYTFCRYWRNWYERTCSGAPYTGIQGDRLRSQNHGYYPFS